MNSITELVRGRNSSCWYSHNEQTSYGASPVVLDHSVNSYLPPEQVNAHRLNPSHYAGTRFTYTGGMEG